MAKTTFVSAKVVLARVIRALGYRLPANYQDDILEWTAEGLGMLQITNSLNLTSSGAIDCPGELLISNHCVALPCGFVQLVAVEDENGIRIPEGGDQTDITLQTSRRHATEDTARPSVFEVNPYVYQTTDGLPSDDADDIQSWRLNGEDIEDSTVAQSAPKYYKINGNYIQTSFETGFIRMHYYALPVDKEGYPLIPDNENFIQALEWHVIRRLIGAGYQHPVFSWDKANDQFEIYAARGISEVSYPSPENIARINRSTVRLIQPYNFYEDFFIGSEQPERLRK